MENESGITKINELSLTVTNLRELKEFILDNVDVFVYWKSV